MFGKRTYAFGSSELTLQFGDILDSSAEVFVSSDDYMLTMGGGVSRAIARAAGSAMVLDAAKSVPRQLGDVVVTTAGALDARYVFHVVTIGPNGDAVSSQDGDAQVKRATERCLDLMDVLDVGSIAFPALGTGAAGLSMEGSASAMADAVVDRLNNSKREYRVSLNFYAHRGMDDKDYIAFYEEFARQRPHIAKRERSAAPVPDKPDPPMNDSTLRLLALEKERLRLEQDIILLKANQSDSSAEDLSEQLRVNQTERITAAVQGLSGRDRPVNVFISYAREDASYCEQLSRHLSNLQELGLIRPWIDREINPGGSWDSDIRDAVNSAELILFLVSADFLASGYIRGVEMARAFERLQNGETTVLPVVIRPVDLAGNRLNKLQLLPTDGRSIDSWPNQDEAYVDVVSGIRRVIDDIRRSPASPVA